MFLNRLALILLLALGTPLTAANHTVSIASVAVGHAKPWQWTVFVRGTPDALSHVRCVQYVLDPSFPNPHRTVCARGVPNQPFASSGTAWGPFTLSATVIFDDKQVQQIRYTVSPP
jgi:transcription initiation factor IIF auxiliary subunit